MIGRSLAWVFSLWHWIHSTLQFSSVGRPPRPSGTMWSNSLGLRPRIMPQPSQTPPQRSQASRLIFCVNSLRTLREVLFVEIFANLQYHVGPGARQMIKVCLSKLVFASEP